LLLPGRGGLRPAAGEDAAALVNDGGPRSGQPDIDAECRAVHPEPGAMGASRGTFETRERVSSLVGVLSTRPTGPRSTMRPWWMTAISSATLCTSARLWVTKSMLRWLF